MKVLVVGATGMLGYSIFSNLSDDPQLNVYGTVRSLNGVERYFDDLNDKVICEVDVTSLESVEGVCKKVRPDVLINCVGLIKQLGLSKQHISAVTINSLLPHQLAMICEQFGTKLIHFSTDCVFDGTSGGYSETDRPTATDLYGRSKSLGEVEYGNHLTLRTSIIGHELNSEHSLIDWFLSQNSSVKGFSQAIFSGLPTSYIAKLLSELILPRAELKGLYNLSVEPIDKYSLLTKVADVYQKNICIDNSNELVIDRSLDSTRLKDAIGFVPPTWDELVAFMHDDYLKRYKF
ncbi:dTDP-4-dehydrorhamnose reductase family protein [Vibrio caribbeanicus]|uniref:dTDP-4-dehydrorhamnose reductase family protein n=1 Tax=Vibrio caribbeanicus TaxID=701175 RepID=UPI0022835428|nr:SDR family oxidoreductase [Vibrio caribbeanicus]MCY9844252.1 SDR family oxidoreductase [Vibrio caribbeanicus]